MESVKVLKAILLGKKKEADIIVQAGLGPSHHLVPSARPLTSEPDESAEPQV